jgi:hypothetical protein
MTDVTDVSQDVADAEPVILPDDNADTGAAHENAEPVEGQAGAETTQTEVADADKPKQTPWWQKRIDEVTKKRYESDARAERAENEARALRALLEANGADLSPTESDAAPANGRTYTEAELNTIAEQKAGQIAAAQSFNAQCNGVYEAGEKAFPDFAEAISNLGMVGAISAHDTSFLQAAFETDAPEKVLHALGKDPDEAARIMALSPTRRAIEMDRLATKLTAAPKARVSGAPAPITPIDASAKPAFDPADPGVSDAEWMAWREKNKKTSGRRLG